MSLIKNEFNSVSDKVYHPLPKLARDLVKSCLAGFCDNEMFLRPSWRSKIRN